jgi:hypothetical protein
MAGTMRDDQLAPARPVVLGDVDLAGKNDRQPDPDLAGPGQRRARAIEARFAESAHPLDLRGLQGREHLVTPRVDDRWRRWGCGHSQLFDSIREPASVSWQGPGRGWNAIGTTMCVPGLRQARCGTPRILKR